MAVFSLAVVLLKRAELPAPCWTARRCCCRVPGSVGRVVVTNRVSRHRASSIGRVVAAGRYRNERGSSDGRVLSAGGVEQHRYAASGGIGFTRVEDRAFQRQHRC